MNAQSAVSAYPFPRGRSLSAVLHEHAMEAAHLALVRTTLVDAPHIRLTDLHRHDQRIAAHLDGLAVGGEAGRQACVAALDEAGMGEVFVAAVRGIEDRDAALLDAVFAKAAQTPSLRAGLHAALGWVSAANLHGIVATLLASQDAQRRLAGLAACIAHGANPGAVLDAVLDDADPRLRALGLRAAGALGRLDLRDACVAALGDPTPAVGLVAAQGAARLGRGNRAFELLDSFARTPGEFQVPALTLLLRLLNLPDAQALLRDIARDPALVRVLIRGAGVVGDPVYLPWLLKQMSDDRLCRLAGESFALITGADLYFGDMERVPTDDADPREDPAADDVALDEDQALPWPALAQVEAWWRANADRFRPGERYFVGAPPSWESCVGALRGAYQRQRHAAAETLCLLRPGSALFNVAAPAWRQQRLIAQVV